jgi:hypothetical protein
VVLCQLAQLAAAQQIRPAVADVHQRGLGAGPQHRRQGCDRLVIVLGELAHRAIGLGDRTVQHGEQFGGRRGGQLQRLEGLEGGGTGLGAARSLSAVGDGQQPLTRVGRVLVTAPRRADVAASGEPKGEGGVRFWHGGASSEVVDEEGGGAPTRHSVGGDLLPVGADRLGRLGGLEATDNADVRQRHTDATQPGDQLGMFELGRS